PPNSSERTASSSQFEVVNPETVKGTVQYEKAGGKQPYKTTTSINAKWVRPNCYGAPAAASGPASAAQALATATFLRIGNDYGTGVVNRSQAEMTAYAVAITRYGNGQTVKHFYNRRMVSRPPIKPGAHFREPQK